MSHRFPTHRVFTTLVGADLFDPKVAGNIYTRIMNPANDVLEKRVASPYLQRPIEHGADIVVHSLTKYLGGKGSGLLTFGVKAAAGEGRAASSHPKNWSRLV